VLRTGLVDRAGPIGMTGFSHQASLTSPMKKPLNQTNQQFVSFKHHNLKQSPFQMQYYD
jgi:hypothetical protein